MRLPKGQRGRIKSNSHIRPSIVENYNSLTVHRGFDNAESDNLKFNTYRTGYFLISLLFFRQ